jgi:hypothetical protein
MRHLASVALWALTAFGIILIAASALESGDAAWAQHPEQSVPPRPSASAFAKAAADNLRVTLTLTRLAT